MSSSRDCAGNGMFKNWKPRICRVQNEEIVIVYHRSIFKRKIKLYQRSIRTEISKSDYLFRIVSSSNSNGLPILNAIDTVTVTAVDNTIKLFQR